MNARKPSEYAAWAALVACGAGLVGCEHGERDPYSANDVAAATAFHARQRAAAMRDSSSKGGDTRTDGASSASADVTRDVSRVRCRCDADGGLHVQAPAGAKVTVAESASEDEADAEIEIEIDRRPSTPIRQTVSLGYVGDGPLTQVPSRGGPWNVPDALLPVHSHGGGGGSGYITSGYVAYGSGYRGGSGFRSGYPGYGGGGGGGGGIASSGPSHNLHYAPHIPTSGGSFGGVGGGGGGGRPAGGGRGPR